jgi:hypothetical protein
VHVYLFHQPADEFDTRFKDAAEAVKAVFMQGDYVHQQGTVDRSAQIKRGTEARGLCTTLGSPPMLSGEGGEV